MADVENPLHDRLTDQIEVTPAMIEVGAAVLAGHYLGNGVYDVGGDVLADVFPAMATCPSIRE